MTTKDPPTHPAYSQRLLNGGGEALSLQLRGELWGQVALPHGPAVLHQTRHTQERPQERLRRDPVGRAGWEPVLTAAQLKGRKNKNLQAAVTIMFTNQHAYWPGVG